MKGSITSEMGAFVIYFDNESAFPADYIGRMLKQLSSDFKRSTGGNGNLVLISAEDGSLKFVLGAVAAAAVFAGHVDDVYNFSKDVIEVVSKARGQHEAPPRARQSANGSAEAILKVAVASKSRLHLKYENGSGEKLYLELDAPTVERAHAKLTHRVSHAKSSVRPRATTSLNSGTSRVELQKTIEEYAASRTQMSSEERVRQDRSFAIAIKLLVQALEVKGGRRSVEDVALSLDRAGLGDIANVVRNSISSPPPTQHLTIGQ